MHQVEHDLHCHLRVLEIYIFVAECLIFSYNKWLSSSIASNENNPVEPVLINSMMSAQGCFR